MTTHDETPSFKTGVNMVMLPVVARDSKGRPVGDLKQEDFKLFDRGKLQTISKFTVEKAETTVAVPIATPPKTLEAQAPSTAPSVQPEHFVAYLFDDVHAGINDLVMARDAADRHIQKSADPKLRAAIFTVSGQDMLDFTDDREKWRQALFKLSPHPIAQSIRECPDLTYFWADRIRNQNDQEALGFAITAASQCSTPRDAAQLVRPAAARVIARHEQEAHVSLDVLRNLVGRLTAMPGQRTIVLVSSGFLTLIGSKDEESVIIDRAIRAKVVINSLDMRGLAVETKDLSKPPPTVGGASAAAFFAYVERMDHEVFNARSDVLAEVANGTGGAFYHNSNDLDAGFQRVAGAPEYRYVLGFSPQNLKLDGSLHALKVSLVNNPRHLDLESRINYTAPKRVDDPVEAAKAEIQEALFSREELSDIPVQVHTEFFKKSPESVELAVLTHVDLKALHLRKAEGRNHDDLTVLSGVFDRNGNYLTGIQRGVELRLKDETFDRWMHNGISVRSTLQVKPGTYLVRVVVRDAEGQLMAAQNCAVDIP